MRRFTGFLIAATLLAVASPVLASELLAQATSCSGQSVTQPCVVDSHTGADTSAGPLANGSVTDSVSAPPLFGYLGQASAQAGFGHVGASAELQVSTIEDLHEAGIQATSGASASDTLKFSTGASVVFAFTLHVPTVDICGLTSGGGGPCDITLARAESGFAAHIVPEYMFSPNRTEVGYDVANNMGTTGTSIAGHWDPNTGRLTSDPIALTDPFTGQIVPGVDVSMAAVSFAALIAFNRNAPEQVTRAAAIFGNTATLTNILVFDASGRLVPDAKITSASGTAYPLADADPSAGVPEPSSSTLTCFGVVIIGGLLLYRSPRRRRLSRSVKKQIDRH